MTDHAPSSSSFLSRARTSTSLFSRSKPNADRRESDTGSGQLGLTTVYTPDDKHKVDIVFIHGLGGTSVNTWTKNKDPELFWPLKFLPLEPSVGSARISTFGYNANFRKSGSLDTTVLDFAKALLSELKNAKDEQGREMNFGNVSQSRVDRTWTTLKFKVPLIFVVHSMGGLIAKEASLQSRSPRHAK